MPAAHLPSGAIDGRVPFKMRAAYIGGEAMEEWVMDSLTSVLGCELCQRVCRTISRYAVEDMPDAFRLEDCSEET